MSAKVVLAPVPFDPGTAATAAGEAGFVAWRDPEVIRLDAAHVAALQAGGALCLNVEDEYTIFVVGPRPHAVPPWPSDPLYCQGHPLPRVDAHMSDDDLTAAAARIRESVDWSKLAETFQRRPPENRYWHELVALVISGLETQAKAAPVFARLEMALEDCDAVLVGLTNGGARNAVKAVKACIQRRLDGAGRG